jgi:hypothetical protein
MGRLKLLGEQEGGGTADHSALSNLDYAQSGHTGFVPSQGEALIDILRLNQNLIRDSGGNDRLQLATSTPHLTLRGDVAMSERLRVGATGAVFTANRFFSVDPGIRTLTGTSVALLHANSQGVTIDDSRNLYALAANAFYNITAGKTGWCYGLSFSGIKGNAGTASRFYGASMTLMSYIGATGAITDARGLEATALWLSEKPSTARGIYIGNFAAAGVTTAEGLKIEDQTGASTNRLLELGPATPYLRLVGGGDPPADKSNLYLKFGSTLYRVVKSGSYMTLEAA